MENWAKYKPNFRYMMLSRLKQDCDYYLGNGNRSTNALWSRNKTDQIANMLALWNTFDVEDKPEWLTKDDIANYARRMGVNYE